MGITYRIGEKQDCGAIAALINIASSGVVDFLLHDLVPNQTPSDIIAHNLSSGEGPYSYQNVIVALDAGRIVGMALSFPSDYHHISAEMKAFFPSKRLSHLRHFYAARVENSMFLDALCVENVYRRLGIGARLIAATRQKARQQGYDSVSLIVFADNRVARNLYKKCGFEIVAKVLLDAHERIPHKGGCLLMKCLIEP